MDNFNNDFNNFERQPNHELNARYGRIARGYDSYDDYDGLDEEFAAEFLAESYDFKENSTSGALIAGALGIIAALVGMFMHPVVLGLSGIALGGYAFAKGNKTAGIIAIIMGVIAAAMPVVHTGAFYTLFR